jgi:hypothetical protein
MGLQQGSLKHPGQTGQANRKKRAWERVPLSPYLKKTRAEDSLERANPANFDTLFCNFVELRCQEYTACFEFTAAGAANSGARGHT